MPTITPLPTPPSRQDPATFSARADAFLSALVLFQQELNAVLPAESAAGLAVSLASTTDATLGAGMVRWLRTLTYAPGTVGHKLQQLLSVLDAPYSADSTGATEAATAFSDAKATGKLVFRPKGTYKRSGTNTTYSGDGFEGQCWFGDRAVSYSDDAVVIIARSVDSSGSGSGHAFTDSSVINRPGDVSYNSFDARVRFEGAHDYGHYAAFQVGPDFAGSGTVDDLYSFVHSPVVSGSGTLTNCTSLQINAPTITGAGDVTNCYGIRWPLGYGKGGAGFNQATGLVLAINNESHAMCYSLGPVQGQDGLIAGNGAGTSYTNVKTIDAVTNAGTLAGLRLQQVGTQLLDLEIPAGQTYATVSNAAGVALKINADRSMVFRGVSTVPTLAALEWAGSPISDTQFQISFRGSDGTLRKHILTLTV